MRQGGALRVPGLNSLVRRCGDIGPTSRACDKNRSRRMDRRKSQRNGVRPSSSEHATWGARKPSGVRRIMSSGRSEKRIARTVRVEVCLQDESELSEGWAENVSAHGARVLVERKLQPGRGVLVRLPKEGVRSQARIVYCQHVTGGRFAVGLELSGRLELWAKP